MRRGPVGVLFFLSGATALAYQVAWTRHLVLLFGNTTHAVSLILAAYMLGLALGSEAGGRMADRVKRPILLYAGFEALIGVYAFLFPALFAAARTGYLSLGTGSTPVLFAGAFLLLLVPTFLMGTTLPLLVRASVPRADATGGVVGWLYGINIVGAVCGTAVTGFWLLETAGILGSTFWAAGVNLVIGALGWWWFRGAGPPVLDSAAGQESTAGPESTAGLETSGDEGRQAAEGDDLATRPRSLSVQRAALLAVCAGGFVGLAAEVVWTRLLVFFLQGFTYTFSAMLATFLSGLAVGGFVFGRVARSSPRPIEVLGRLQIAVGVAAAGVLLLLTHHLPVTQWAWDLAGSLTGATNLRVHHVVALLLASALILFPPACLMGGVFPLAAAAYQRGLADLGSRIGRLYAVNTVGAVAGSLVAGFVLAPTVGPTWAAVMVAGVSLLSGVTVLRLAGAARMGRWAWGGVGCALAAGLLWAADPSEAFILRSHAFAGRRGREHRLVRTLNGTVCQVSVIENEREGFSLLYTDEFEAAGTKPEYRYMRMLAHLPVALARDPSRVLVICFGTGTTAGSVSTHPDVRELDIVEISPQILEVADRFAHLNRDVLGGAGRDDLTVRTHVDDGRNFVLRSREQWDVVTLEPLMPYTPAAIHFYTEDFYRECSERLSPGGLMCQWIPLQGMSGKHFKMLVAAFVAVYPDAAMFFVDGAVALIGGGEAVELDFGRVEARLSAPDVRADLADVGFEDPVTALNTFIAGGKILRDFVKGVEPVTDEYPVLEFHPIPLGVGLKHLWENLRHMEGLRARYDRLPVHLEGRPGSEFVEDRLRNAFFQGNRLIHGMARSEEASLLKRVHLLDEAVQAFVAAREAFELAYGLDPADETARRYYNGIQRAWAYEEARNAVERGDLGEAEGHLRRAIRFPAQRHEDEAWTVLANVLNRQERFEEALDAALEATTRFPRGPRALGERAYARAALGDLAGGARDYRRAMEDDGPSVLSARLRNDARRVLATTAQGATTPLGEAVEEALSGKLSERIPAATALRLLAAEHPTAYRKHFADDVRTAAYGAPTGPDLDRVRALGRLRDGAVPGADRIAEAVLLDAGASDDLRAVAATTLASMNPHSLASRIRDRVPLPSLLALTRAAAIPDRDVLDELLPLLDHEELEIREAAQRAAFAVLGRRAPGLGTLAPRAWPSNVYREQVQDLISWWVRTREGFVF